MRIKFVFFLLFVSLVFYACTKSKEYLLIVDTSGSMNKNRQMEMVKKSIRQVILQYQKGDVVHLLTFDSDVKQEFTIELNCNSDLSQLLEKLDRIEANGKWTNLIAALNESLTTVRKLKKRSPSKEVTLILYTDGKHDLPEGHKDNTRLNFDDLFNKFYKNFDTRKPNWFIYYVSLGNIDNNLKEFINKSRSGKVIMADKFHKNLNVTGQRLNNSIIITVMAIVLSCLFLLHIILFFIGPWFSNYSFVCINAKSYGAGHPTSFDLSDYPKSFFRNYLIIGSNGDIPILGADILRKHAGLGINIFGKIYIRPIGKGIVYVNGVRIKRKRVIDITDKVTIGYNDFILKENI